MAKSHEELGYLLQDIGHSLKSDPLSSAVELREGGKTIRQIGRETDNSHVKFQSYFLGNVIDDAWHNLAMAVSQSVDNHDLADILTLFGTYFKFIGEGLMDRDFVKCYQLNVEFLNKYLSEIEQVEVITS